MFATSIWHLAVISLAYIFVVFTYFLVCIYCCGINISLFISCMCIFALYCYFCSGFCVIMPCLSFSSFPLVFPCLLRYFLVSIV